MLSQLIKAAFAGAQKAKREAQFERKDMVSHWRYQELNSNPLLHPTPYLFRLAKDANSRKHEHDLRCIIDYLHRHTAYVGSYGEIMQYCTRAYKRITKASY